MKEEYKPINGVYRIELLQVKIRKTIVKEIELEEDSTVVKYTTIIKIRIFCYKYSIELTKNKNAEYNILTACLMLEIIRR